MKYFLFFISSVIIVALSSCKNDHAFNVMVKIDSASYNTERMGMVGSIIFPEFAKQIMTAQEAITKLGLNKGVDAASSLTVNDDSLRFSIDLEGIFFCKNCQDQSISTSSVKQIKVIATGLIKAGRLFDLSTDDGDVFFYLDFGSSPWRVPTATFDYKEVVKALRSVCRNSTIDDQIK